MITVGCKITEAVAEKLDEKAAAANMTRSAYIAHIIAMDGDVEAAAARKNVAKMLKFLGNIVCYSYLKIDPEKARSVIERLQKECDLS